MGKKSEIFIRHIGRPALDKGIAFTDEMLSAESGAAERTERRTVAYVKLEYPGVEKPAMNFRVSIPEGCTTQQLIDQFRETLRIQKEKELILVGEIDLQADVASAVTDKANHFRLLCLEKSDYSRSGDGALRHPIGVLRIRLESHEIEYVQQACRNERYLDVTILPNEMGASDWPAFAFHGSYRLPHTAIVGSSVNGYLEKILAEDARSEERGFVFSDTIADLSEYGVYWVLPAELDLSKRYNRAQLSEWKNEILDFALFRIVLAPKSLLDHPVFEPLV